MTPRSSASGIFRWKGTIQPAVVDDIAANLDLYATFASLTGGDEPRDKPGYCSQNISSTLLKKEASPRNQWLYGTTAYRSGRYKIHTATQLPTDPDTRKRQPVTRHNPPLLFDLSSDLGETRNIAARHPEVVTRLLAEMKAFVKLGVEHIDGLHYVVVGREIGRQRKVLAKIKIPQARSELRLRVADGILHAEYRLQPRSPWKEAATSEIPAQDQPWHYGILTQDGEPKSPGTALIRDPLLVADASLSPKGTRK